MKTQTKRKKPELAKGPEFPKSIETFKQFGSYELNEWTWNTPSVWNGVVSVRKYRVTIEEIIDEEAERDRVRKLWRESDNHHHYAPLRAVAESFGMELDSSEFGKDRKDRK